MNKPACNSILSYGVYPAVTQLECMHEGHQQDDKKLFLMQYNAINTNFDHLRIPMQIYFISFYSVIKGQILFWIWKGSRILNCPGTKSRLLEGPETFLAINTNFDHLRIQMQIYFISFYYVIKGQILFWIWKGLFHPGCRPSPSSSTRSESRQKSFERGNYPLLPTGIGDRYSQTISNLRHACSALAPM